MNKIDITKIAVKFDVENTTEELFNSVVEKFVELGYNGSLEDIAFEDLWHWSVLLIDEEGDLMQAKSYWSGLVEHIIMPPTKFLALQNELVPILSDAPVLTLPDNSTIIAEWLNKVQHVFDNEATIRSIDYSTMILETDFGDIRGAKEIVEFINNNYEMLKINENAQKKAELEAKRKKLMDELSEIDQQLGLYN